MKLFNALLLIACAALSSRSEILVFDCSTGDSPLRKGTIRLTESGSHQALWKGTEGLRSHQNPVVTAWTEDKNTGRKTPPAVYQNDLTCDYLASAQPCTLTLKLPAGPYDLLLLCGRAGGKAAQVWDIRAAHGTAAVSATFAGAHELRMLQLTTEATDQGIELQFTTRSRWLLNALIVIPAADRQRARSELIEPLLKECWMLPPEELSKWREAPPPGTAPEPRWTEKQRQDGLALFARPWVEPVWPDHLPLAHELDAPVRAFAAQGEYEPLTFTLHPLKDFSEISLTVGELRCTAGGQQYSIAGDQLDIRFVRYMFVRPNYNTYNTFYRAPDVLMPWQPQPLTKGENLRIWITVRTGTAQPAGVYTGEATVTAQNLTLAVPLSLRVLPITLQRDQSLVYGQYYHHPFDNLDRAPDDFSRAWWQHKAEAEHIDMREHGMNTVVLGIGGSWKNERWHYHFDLLQRKIDLYRRAGFDKPVVCHFPCDALYRKYMNAGMGSHLSLIQMPPEAFFTELTAMVQSVEREARRRQWPELLYYPVDEPSTSPVSVAFMTRVMAAIKQVPHVRTYVTADPEHEQFAPPASLY